MAKKKKVKKNNLKEFFNSKREDKLGWALVFFWGALVVLADLSGYLGGIEGWSLFFTGVGVIVLAFAPFLFYAGNKKAWFNVIFGIVFLSIGVGDFISLRWIWVVILIALGYATLRSVFDKK
ncbi:hypothetical protein ACFLZZ_00460 [Nanoarchaeota archaeon]